MRFKSFTFRVAEMAMSIGAVLVFFLLFIGIMSLSFPKGTGLRDLLVFDETQEQSGRGRMDLELAEGQEATIGLVARLTEVSRRVKDKRASSISWQDARSGIVLESGHAVQTFSRSGATIAFDENASLDVAENSLVIIRAMSQSRDRSEKRASLVILDGELHGSLAEGRGETLELEIVTASSVSKIRSADGREADFKILAHDDNSSSIAIFAGRAEVTAGGKTVIVDAPQVLGVDAAGNFRQMVRIPSAPALTSPQMRAEFTYSLVPPEVRLEWEDVAAADGYQVQIARDSEFGDLVLDTTVQAAALVHGNLVSGRYFWRVHARSESIAGLAAPARMFDVLHDSEPPRLEVTMPNSILNTFSFLLKGVTEPGAQVFVGDQLIPISRTGEFEYDLSLEPGPNVLVVEAFDPAGNVAYVSQLVHAKHQVKP